MALSLLAGLLPLQALAETPAGPEVPGGTAAGQSGGPGDPDASPAEDGTAVYYEVRFALPDELGDLPPEEAEAITMPETQLLRSGTPIASIALPERLGYVFVGWYYDAALETRWAEGDVVDRNMTLYPRFAAGEDQAGGLVLNYMSDQDVSPGFPVYVAAYDLTEEEAAALISVRDLSEMAEAQIVAFALEPQETDPAELVPDGERREEILAALARWQANGGSLGDALRAAGADDGMIQVELAGTDSLRFLRNGQESSPYVVFYNLTVVFEPYNNMRLRGGLKCIPAAEVEGVDLNDGLFRAA